MQVGHASAQGVRPTMEDTHVVHWLGRDNSSVLLGLFDGHGGTTASRFAANHFVRTFEQCNQSFECTYQSLDDAMFRELSAGDRAGTTALGVHITPSHIVVANAGDCRAVVGGIGTRKIEYTDLSVDHKPTLEQERRRIEHAGGIVSDDARVDNVLAVSRGLGDFNFKGCGSEQYIHQGRVPRTCKNSTLPPDQKKVTSTPDIRRRPRRSHDRVLIIACDGLWDVMSSKDGVVDALCQLQRGHTVQHTAQTLVDTAIRLGSRDNVSVIVVEFNS